MLSSARPTPDVNVDPQASLSAAGRERWKKLYVDWASLTTGLTATEGASASGTRRTWGEELALLGGRIGEASRDDQLGSLEAALDKFRDTVYATTIPAYQGWIEVLDQYIAERERLTEEPGLSAVYALERLEEVYGSTKAGSLDPDFVVQDDYLALKSMLDKNDHLSLGELRAARQRVEALKQALEVVGDLRGAGEDPDTLVPEWNERFGEEEERLATIAGFTTNKENKRYFQELTKEIKEARNLALARKPRKKSAGEKLFGLVAGAVSAVTDPLFEAVKQLADLGQIVAHFTSFGRYEPKMVSDLGKAAEKGATTTELLEGMAMGLIETPERLAKAIKNGDWEGIGRETVNLYMLAKAGKAGMSKAGSMLRLVRARAAVMRGGGMGASAAMAVRRIAMKAKLAIRFRFTEAPTVKLLEKGHVPKPEALKMKTIKDVDVHLGATQAEIGQVGYFEPKLPGNLKTLDPTLQQAIQHRYTARLAEWHKYGAEVADLTKKGLIEHKGRLIVDPKTQKGFTGDYDLFDIRQGGPQGPSVEFESLSKDVQTALKSKPIHAQHGAHLDWREIPSGYADAFAEIVLQARPKGRMGPKGVYIEPKPLIEFLPDGRIRYTYFYD